jgi:hypothetical protein
MQNSKIEVLEWLANEQDESFVQEIVSFIKKHTYERKVEEDFLKPMTEQELYDKIVNTYKTYEVKGSKMKIMTYLTANRMKRLFEKLGEF